MPRHDTNDADEGASSDERVGCRPTAQAAGDGDDSVGVPVPEDHVGAFVAEAFEDVERSTTWADVVDAMVAPDAREAWDDLSPREQAVEVLDTAAGYDERATEQFEALQGNPRLDVDQEAAYGDALRLRHNADAFRDGIASAYAEGHLDDAAIVGAVEDAGFETERIAEREDALEVVANAHDLDYRPYGGTLFDQDDEDGREEVDPW